MARPTAIRQVWRCPTCKVTYRSPIEVKEVLCPKKHTGRGNPRLMKLIEEPLKNAR